MGAAFRPAVSIDAIKTLSLGAALRIRCPDVERTTSRTESLVLVEVTTDPLSR